MRALSCVVLAAVLVVPSTASAFEFKPRIGFHGGWSTYAMSDMNRSVRATNRLLAGTGIGMDELKSGFDAGLTVCVDVSPRYSIGLGYDHLFGSVATDDPARSLVFQLPANVFRVIGECSLPPLGPLQTRAGVSGGIVSEFGVLETAGGPHGDLSGHGPVAEADVSADWWATPQFAVTGSVGYRYARVNEVKFMDLTVRNFDDGSKLKLDYSGVLVRLGVRLGIGR